MFLHALRQRLVPSCLIGLATFGLGTAPTAADDPAELINRLSDFDVIALNVPADRPAQLTVAVPIDGILHDITLARVSVWAPDAKVLVHRGDGVVDEIDPPAPNTYRGSVAGLPGSSVTSAIKSDGLHAIVRKADGETWEVVPLDGLGMYAVHRASDYARTPSICPVSHAPDDLDPDMPPANAGGPAAGAGSSTHVAELLIECDYEYYLWNGSAADALEEMALVINNINEPYERDLNITHVLTRAIIRTSEPDPYTTSYGPALLDEFEASLATYPSGWFDLAMLFTNKDAYNEDGYGLAGLANVGRVCSSSTGLASGFSEAISNDTTQAMLVAHELGHIWNARHCGPSGSIDSSCVGNSTPCNIMCGILGGCDDDLAFGPCAASAVTAHRDSRDCLDPGTNGIQWVQWRPCGFGCPEDGDFEDPHNTVAEAVAASSIGGTIIIKAGASAQAGDAESFPLVIDKAVTIRSFVDRAVIGH